MLHNFMELLAISTSVLLKTEDIEYRKVTLTAAALEGKSDNQILRLSWVTASNGSTVMNAVIFTEESIATGSFNPKTMSFEFVDTSDGESVFLRLLQNGEVLTPEHLQEAVYGN